MSNPAESAPIPAAEEGNLFDISGKVAIVTGGNGGIGLGMARGLAAAGAKVAIVGRNSEKSKAAARELFELAGVETLSITADLSHLEQIEPVVQAVLDRYGRIDVLVNNAAINIRKQPQDMTLDEWQEVINVNLTSVFAVCKAAYPALKASGRGRVINIGSMTSIFGSGFASAYAASKGAIVQLTKSLALAWANDKICVNAILPGWFDTELTQQARKEVPGLYNRVSARIPIGRWAVPDDIAGTVIWLSSPASDYVTGIAIAVDGGYSAAL